MDTTVDLHRFRLADLLANLSDELRQAQQRAASDNNADVFRVTGCTVELGVTWERNDEGAVEFSVVKLSGASRAETESIIISLEPAGERGAGGGHPLTKDNLAQRNRRQCGSVLRKQERSEQRGP